MNGPRSVVRRRRLLPAHCGATGAARRWQRRGQHRRRRVPAGHGERVEEDRRRVGRLAVDGDDRRAGGVVEARRSGCRPGASPRPRGWRCMPRAARATPSRSWRWCSSDSRVSVFCAANSLSRRRPEVRGLLQADERERAGAAQSVALLGHLGVADPVERVLPCLHREAPLRHRRLQLLQRVVEVPAVRAEDVRPLHQVHRCVRRSLQHPGAGEQLGLRRAPECARSGPARRRAPASRTAGRLARNCETSVARAAAPARAPRRQRARPGRAGATRSRVPQADRGHSRRKAQRPAPTRRRRAGGGPGAPPGRRPRSRGPGRRCRGR